MTRAISILIIMVAGAGLFDVPDAILYENPRLIFSRYMCNSTEHTD